MPAPLITCENCGVAIPGAGASAGTGRYLHPDRPAIILCRACARLLWDEASWTWRTPALWPTPTPQEVQP